MTPIITPDLFGMWLWIVGMTALGGLAVILIAGLWRDW